MTKTVIQKQISEKPEGEREERFHLAELQTKPLVKKLVESIMHNVINSGNNVLLLPVEMNCLCVKGYNLGGESFWCD
jgi:hypothetical protein